MNSYVIRVGGSGPFLDVRWKSSSKSAGGYRKEFDERVHVVCEETKVLLERAQSFVVGAMVLSERVVSDSLDAFCHSIAEVWWLYTHSPPVLEAELARHPERLWR